MFVVTLPDNLIVIIRQNKCLTHKLRQNKYKIHLIRNLEVRIILLKCQDIFDIILSMDKENQLKKFLSQVLSYFVSAENINFHKIIYPIAKENHHLSNFNLSEIERVSLTSRIPKHINEYTDNEINELMQETGYSAIQQMNSTIKDVLEETKSDKIIFYQLPLENFHFQIQESLCQNIAFDNTGLQKTVSLRATYIQERIFGKYIHLDCGFYRVLE